MVALGGARVILNRYDGSRGTIAIAVGLWQ